MTTTESTKKRKRESSRERGPDHDRLPVQSTTAQNTAPSHDFVHEPLDLNPSHQCIRLLKIQPGNAEVVQCEVLINVKLIDKPLYLALSYEWGSLRSPRQISIGGRTMSVRRNLYDFMRRYAASRAEGLFVDDPLLIWIDALCIDQSSVDERNHQVSQMKRIYKQAQEVLIWLGEPTAYMRDVSEKAVTTCHLLQRIIPLNLQCGDHTGSDGCIAALDSRRLHYWTIHAIAKHSYWQRVWIIQEIVLSRKARILHGEIVLSWKAWVTATRFLSAHEGHDPVRQPLTASPATRIVEQWLKRRLRHRQGILQLAADFASSKASDPHDKIYALLGVASNAVNIQVNYKMPTSSPLFEAIAYARQIPGWDGLENICVQMGLNSVMAHFALDFEPKCGHLCSSLTQKKHLIDTGRYDERWAEVVHPKELALWSCYGRVRCCTCVSCQRAWPRTEMRAHNVRHRIEAVSLDESQTKGRLRPMFSARLILQSQPVHQNQQNNDQVTSNGFEYTASAVYIPEGEEQSLLCPDSELFPMSLQLPLLLLYYDPAMTRSPSSDDSVPALDSSMRHLAHMLPSRRNARHSHPGVSAIGVQERAFEAVDELAVQYGERPLQEGRSWLNNLSNKALDELIHRCYQSEVQGRYDMREILKPRKEGMRQRLRQLAARYP